MGRMEDEDDEEGELDEGAELVEVLALEVEAHEAGQTALAFLSEQLPDVPTASLRHLIQDGGVTINGRPCGPGQTVAEGDVLELDPDDLDRIEPARLEGFGVLYEDEHVLACLKPAGVAVEAERGDEALPFKAAVLHHFVSSRRDEKPPRPRVVHRLDKDTTGVVLVAKTKHGLADLTRQLEERRVTKEYLALVLGRVHQQQGEIDLPLPDPAAVGRGPRPMLEAKTAWEVVERFHTHSLLRCHPVTGRQHQIRQHLAASGHPLAVDTQYGGGASLLLSKIKRGYRPKTQGEEKPLLGRLSLHAHRIVFAAPGSGQQVEVVAPLPDDFEVALRQLRKWDTAEQQRPPGRGRRSRTS